MLANERDGWDRRAKPERSRCGTTMSAFVCLANQYSVQPQHEHENKLEDSSDSVPSKTCAAHAGLQLRPLSKRRPDNFPARAKNEEQDIPATFPSSTCRVLKPKGPAWKRTKSLPTVMRTVTTLRASKRQCNTSQSQCCFSCRRRLFYVVSEAHGSRTINFEIGRSEARSLRLSSTSV